MRYCFLVHGLRPKQKERRHRRRPRRAAAGTMLSDIGYIKSGVDDIKAEQKEQRKTNIEVVSRITAVEESAKQAHKRIDELSGRKA